MGWERKRGKLHELNRLLRGATDTTFVAHGGEPLPIVPAGVRYVITLDADTRLPRGAAKRLVGKMAHPLNGPRFDPQLRARGRRLRGAAAASHAVAADRPRGIDFPARVLQRERYRPVRLRGLRRVPGPVRRRFVQRQGNLRRRYLRGRAPRPRSRQRAAESRPVRGNLRARRIWSPTSRWSRNFRRATTSPLRGSIDGRAAIGNCCPGFSAAVIAHPARPARRERRARSRKHLRSIP